MDEGISASPEFGLVTQTTRITHLYIEDSALVPFDGKTVAILMPQLDSLGMQKVLLIGGIDSNIIFTLNSVRHHLALQNGNSLANS